MAQVIAEDTEAMRGKLRGMLNILRIHRLTWPVLKGHLVYSYKIDCIVDEIHFMDKATPNAPILQIADACAWGLRRAFNGQPQAETDMLAMKGSSELPMLDVFISSGCISPELAWPNDVRVPSEWNIPN